MLVAIESSSLKKLNNVIQFYGEILFYSKSPITFQLLYFNKCIDRLKVGLKSKGYTFATKVEVTMRITTFTIAEILEAPFQMWFLNFCSISTCHNLIYSFVCSNIVGISS
jgi:hypothetical protein